MEAVVAKEKNEGALFQAQAVECADDAADLRVHERHAREVSAEVFAAILVGEFFELIGIRTKNFLTTTLS